MGYEQKEIDLFFRSLANPSLPFDRYLQRLFMVFQRGGFAIQLQIAREQDNVNNEQNLPTLNNDLANLVLSYTPTLSGENQDVVAKRWFGQPSFSLSAQHAEQEHARIPLELIESKIDRLTSYYQGGAYFQYDTWSWGLNHSYGQDKDFTSVSQKNRSELTDMNLQLTAGERFSMNAMAQYSSMLDRNSQNVTRSWIAGLDTRVAMFDQKLSTSFSYSLNQDDSKDDLFKTDSKTLGLRFDWLARTPRSNQPGWTIWLQGERQDFDDRLSPLNNQSIYQVFLGARMDWPLAFPRNN
ncbi:MAG: hypothetical protein ACI8P9_000718 [Parasphingorhabdus sp.]